CTSSIAAAAGSARSTSPPAASATARQRTGRTRFPPDSSAYRRTGSRPPSSSVSGSPTRCSSTTTRSSSRLRSGIRQRTGVRERDRLVDRDLGGHRPLLQLVDADPQDVALERTHALGGPLVRRLGHAAIEILGPGGDRARELGRELVRLALVQRRERLTGEIPLVEEKERRPPPCAP